MKNRQIKQSVQDSDVGRLDAWLAKTLQMPRARARGLVQIEGIVLNGTMIQDPAQLLNTGDQVQFSYDPQRKYQEIPLQRKPKGFDLVYLDDDMAVVNKSAGILTVPTDRGESNCLIDLVSQYIKRGPSRKPAVSVIHRLDRDTSGLLVFGRNPFSTERLIEQFSEHKAQRIYWAIVKAQMTPSEGRFDTYFTTDASLNQKSVDDASRRKNPTVPYERAITYFRTIKLLHGASLVEVRLETGRRNQIRVHFAESGHPVLGDTRYESILAQHPKWPHRRLALHAKTLGLVHPRTLKPMLFEVPAPREFLEFGV